LKHHPGFYGAGYNLKKADFAELVDLCLKHKEDGRAGGVLLDRFAPGRCFVAGIGRGGRVIGYALQQLSRAEPRHGAAAENGGDRAARYAVADAFFEFFVCIRFAAEELFHERFIGFGDVFTQQFKIFLNGRRHIGGNRHLCDLAAVDGIRFARDDVDDARGFIALCRRDGDRAYRNAEFFAQFFNRPDEIGILFVDFGYINETRFSRAVLPTLLSTHTNAAFGRGDEYGGIGDAQGLKHLS
jgi:hypothetical protein